MHSSSQFWRRIEAVDQQFTVEGMMAGCFLLWMTKTRVERNERIRGDLGAGI
jgi:hypothetical protein